MLMQEERYICTLQLNPLDSMSTRGAEIKAWSSCTPPLPEGITQPDTPGLLQKMTMLWAVGLHQPFTQPAPPAGMAADPQGSRCRREISLFHTTEITEGTQLPPLIRESI